MGSADCVSEGAAVGFCFVGGKVGIGDGGVLGAVAGSAEGVDEGAANGTSLGLTESLPEGASDGNSEGGMLGSAVNCPVWGAGDGA